LDDCHPLYEPPIGVSETPRWEEKMQRKTLASLVHDRTFLARRHAELLELDPLVKEPELRALQVAYRAEESNLERQATARRFEKVCRSIDREELTMYQGLLAGMGPFHPLPLSSEEVEELRAKWERWDKRDGFSWRVIHDAMHNDDRLLAYKRLTGDSEQNLDRIREEVPDLAERAREILSARKPPNPPGWQYVTPAPRRRKGQG
jgi:hypothetical protein